MSVVVPPEYLFQEELYALKSKVMVVLNTGWNDLSTDDQLLLTKILSSIRKDIASVQIISMKEFDLEDLMAYSPRQIVAFGAVNKTPHPLYHLISMQGISLIQADSLPELDDSKKKSLWMALKQMFSV